jgi:AraC-like DNA-binding protein
MEILSKQFVPLSADLQQLTMSTKRIIIPQDVLDGKKRNSADIYLLKYTSSTTRANFETFLTEYAIVYILSGKKEISISDTVYHVGKGELFLLPKGEYIMSEYTTDDESFRSIILYFNSKISQKALSEIEISNISLSFQKKNSTERTIHTIPVTTDIENVFQTLMSYIEKDVFFKKELVQLKFMELLFLLLNGEFSGKIMQFLVSAVKLEKPDIAAIVSEYIHTPITIKKLAMLTGRSISQFKRDFIQLYDSYPHQWLVKKKLEHAIYLLKTTSKSIEQISDTCGFANPTHFSRVFKKEYGIVPSKYMSE